MLPFGNEFVFFAVIFTGGGAAGKKSAPGISDGLVSVTLGDGSGNSLHIIAKEPEKEDGEAEAQTLIYFSSTQSVEWLKDMYHVQLTIMNQADSDFVLRNASAEIDLPKGLSLASITSGQTRVLQLGDIGGQEVVAAGWVVKGDAPGNYDIRACFSADMYPFRTPIYREFETTHKVVVRSGEGLHVLVQPDSGVFYNETSYMYFSLVNVSNRTLYNVKFYSGTGTGNDINSSDGTSDSYKVTTYDPSTGQYTTCDTTQTVYILPDASGSVPVPDIKMGDGYEVQVFEPGDSISCRMATGLQPSDDDHYLQLVGAFAEVLEGANLGVTVSIEPIRNLSANHKLYENSDGTFFYGDPVDVATGAFTKEIEALSDGMGESLFAMSYHSVEDTQQEGACGFGWKYNNEPHIEEKEGKLYLYQPFEEPEEFVTETQKEEKTKPVCGTVLSPQTIDRTVGVTLLVSLCKPIVLCGKYVSRSDGKAVLEKEEKDGSVSYTLTDADGTIWTFDEEGSLCTVDRKSGRKEVYERTEEQCVISDDTGKILLTYDYRDGKIVRISDGAKRNVQLTYDESGDLTSYTDAEGKSTYFVYDNAHHILEIRTHTGIVLVKNTYDTKGRVLTQTEAGNEEKTYFSYEEISSTISRTKIRKRDGNELVYNSNLLGKVLSATDENGNTTYYRYDEKGRLIGKTLPDYSTQSWEYDENGDLTGMGDTAGNKVIYGYDTDGNLTQITGEDSLGGTYEYDDNGKMIKYVSPLGEERRYIYQEDGMLQEEVIEGLGSYFYEYQDGRLISKTDPLGNRTGMQYDDYGNVVLTTNPLGYKSESVYDKTGRLLSCTDEAGVKTVYEYDDNGFLQSETIGERRTAYTYDEAGRRTGMINAEGEETSYAYDCEGNLIAVTYPDKSTYSYTYDKAGNQTGESFMGNCKKTVSYNAVGNIKSVSENGLVTYFDTYPNGKMKKAVYPDGTSKTYRYHTDWTLASVTDQDGNVTSYTYDAAGNLLSQTDALGQVITYTYDVHGRRTSQTDARGYTEKYDYDAVGNCISRTDAAGTVYRMKYDALGRMTEVSVDTENGPVTNRFGYDAAGNVIRRMDAEGNVTDYSYDTYGNLLRVTDPMGNVTQESRYDEMDRLISQTDAAGSKTLYEYDRSGNVVSVRKNDGTPVQKTYSYIYTKDNLLTQSTGPDDSTAVQEYTSSGQLLRVTDPMGGVTQYSYDRLDRVIAVTDAIGSRETYTYNAQGLLSEETDAAGSKTTYTYDALGRIMTQKDEAGTIRYRYDENGNVLSVSEYRVGMQAQTVTRTYDACNRVTSVTDYNGRTVRYSYDELGNRISVTYPGGEIVRYAYDKCGRMIKVTGEAGTGAAYSYDKNGRLIQQKRTDGSCESYGYDTAGRLVYQKDTDAAGKQIHTFTYCYDEAGNIVEKTGETKTGTQTGGTEPEEIVMTYDADNRLRTWNGETVTYDANGNMTYGPLADTMAQLTYDCRNRLIRTETADGSVTTYTYDAENIRMTATTDGICHSYVTDRESEYSQLLEETITTEDGILPEMETGRKTYLYGNGLLAMKRDETPEIWYYHYNNTGSTTEVTDQNGKIVYRISYGTYGELRGILDGNGEEATDATPTSSSGSLISALRFLYNGQLGVETEENGLYYMRARYYNPQIKRFISRDPLEGDITDSRTLNHYSYVLGNPVSLTDPFGLCAEEYYSQKGHEALDILGYFFDLADAANTIWYAAEGNYKMAGINLIAVIPIAGSGISKAGKEAAEEATEKAAIKAMREGAEEATEKATKEAAEKYARENAQKYAKKNATQNAAKSADDAAKAAGKMGKSGSSFPENPDDLLPEISRKKVTKPNGTTSQIIQTSDSIRIRAEQHPLLPGETYNPKHHGVHYHVEYKVDPTKSWNNKNNVKKWYPDGYTHGAGSGFIPGEAFPK